jgi:hypothetical protein
MDFEESLKNVLTEGLSKIILSGIKVVDTILFPIDSQLQVVGYTLLRTTLKGYTEGRTIGNCQRIMEKHNYFLNKKEVDLLNEDWETFREDYYLDSRNNEMSELDDVSESKIILDTKKFFCDNAKRHQTERQLDTAYFDEWIMYNKLFSNKQI